MTARLTPMERAFKASFNWVTQAGAGVIKNLPLGGIAGIMAGVAIAWFAPSLIPEGWGLEAVLSIGMGAGVLLHRVVDGAIGWFLEPVRRHVGSRWEAWIRLRKLRAYEQQGVIRAPELAELRARIVKDDVSPRKRRA